jgi:hypothetical protein
VLVVAQIAACAAFLVMATGVVDELRRLSRTDTALAIDSVADVRVPREYRQAIADRLAADPRVLSVAAAYRPPLYGPLWTLFVSRAGVSETVPVGMTVVSPERAITLLPALPA